MNGCRFPLLVVISVIIIVFTNSITALCTTAVATARIIKQVTLIQDAGRDLKFGQIIPGTGGGKVIVGVNDNRTCSETVILGEVVTTPSASFAVCSDDGLIYSIMLPKNVTVICGKEQLTIDHFTSATSSVEASIVSDSTTITQHISVGAILNIGTSTSARGSYVGTFPISVNYN